MRKGSSFFILAMLLLHFYNGLIPLAYGQSLVFGPEFFIHETGKHQQVVNGFSIQDANRKFMLSIQREVVKKNGLGSCSININGVAIISSDECGKPFKMLTKPVKLRKKNNISIEITGGVDTSMIVTIMSLDEHLVIAKIPPIGKVVDLEGYASIAFPSASFDDAQQVKMYTTASPSMDDIFEAHATGPRLPYEIRINTGNKAPGKDMIVDINIPDSFYSSLYQIHIFALMQDNSGAPAEQGRFVKLYSGLDGVLMTVRTMLPRHAFSNLYSKKGTYEAVITVGLIPLD